MNNDYQHFTRLEEVTDPFVQAPEEEGFDWARQWYPVAFVDDLDPTKPHSIELLGKRLVLWRDADKRWRTFEDKCPHRLAPLSGELAPAWHCHTAKTLWSPDFAVQASVYLNCRYTPDSCQSRLIFRITWQGLQYTCWIPECRADCKGKLPDI